MRWTRNVRNDNIFPLPLPPPFKPFLPSVEKWAGGGSHQCWLPLHSGSIPPPAAHYPADREPLGPHLDGFQPRAPPCQRQQTLLQRPTHYRRPTLSPLNTTQTQIAQAMSLIICSQNPCFPSVCILRSSFIVIGLIFYM